LTGYDCTVLEELVEDALRRAVRSCNCDCIALSGGIDTSTVALAARLEGLRLRGYTAYYTKGLPRDLPYTLHAAAALGIPLKLLPITDEYIAEKAKLIVGCTGVRTEVEVRNDIVFLRALEEAKRDGCRCILLGDGGDEIFAGYTFTLQQPSNRLKTEILRMGVRGRYPGLELAECLNLEACAPLLSDEIIEAVMNAPEECLRTTLMQGKRTLRNILAKHGPHIIAERRKTPAEQGAGTENLNAEILTKITKIEIVSGY
jgi:asparagine synthase (glutamine-hydrolysing)